LPVQLARIAQSRFSSFRGRGRDRHMSVATRSRWMEGGRHCTAWGNTPRGCFPGMLLHVLSWCNPSSQTWPRRGLTTCTGNIVFFSHSKKCWVSIPGQWSLRSYRTSNVGDTSRMVGSARNMMSYQRCAGATARSECRVWMCLRGREMSTESLWYCRSGG